MGTFKITLAYDGSDFVGWQRQASGVSIQGLIEDALRELDGRDVPVIGAGRTDAGVHALGQVASFSLERVIEAGVLQRAVNARMPDSVRVTRVELAAPAFHARFDAREKTYRYRIWNAAVISPFERKYAWHIPERLDVDAMCAAAQLVEGRHDFAAFQAAGNATKTTERAVHSSVITSKSQTTVSSLSGVELRDLRGGVCGGALILYDITGDGFLRHMVRNIVGTLVEIGRGRRPPAWMREVVESRDRAAAGPTAPAHGLFLVRVTYGQQLAAQR